MAESMTILKAVYTSAPAGELIVPTLEINIPGQDPLYLCNGFEDRIFFVSGVPKLFTAGPLTVALPAKNNTGQQTLKFGFSGVSGQAQRYVDAALASDQISTMIFREYLLSDITVPAGPEYRMTIVGGSFEGANAVFEGSYYDLLNSKWPWERYTAETAPGIKYLS